MTCSNGKSRKSRDPWASGSLLRDEPVGINGNEKIVYFHQNHHCEDGVCEYRPVDVRGVLVEKIPYGRDSVYRGWRVKFSDGEQMVCASELFWRRREGVELVM